MSDEGPLGGRLLGIAVAALVMLAGVLAVGATLRGGPDVPAHPEPGTLETGQPITEEAAVFSTRAADLAVDPTVQGRPGASGRSLAGFRALRAYPGAPPRIPHALADDEFLQATCNQCHRRGGWAPRFGAYAPVSPHPEFSNCLQCHVPANTGELFRPTGWVAAAWPVTGRRAMEGSPPVVPHALEMRGNCVSCHAGPAAVAEIRTTHPERANCRQCHVPALGGPEPGAAFSRPLERPGGAAPPDGPDGRGGGA
ncbi:MAG: hypothetical protein RH859_13835 [Longimicrobiales bacterium]